MATADNRQHPIVRELARRLRRAKDETLHLGSHEAERLAQAIDALEDGNEAAQVARQLLSAAHWLEDEQRSKDAADRVCDLAGRAAKRSLALQKAWHATAARALDGRARFDRFQDRSLVRADDPDAAYRRDKPVVRPDSLMARVRV